jgi:hypothetical protein
MGEWVEAYRKWLLAGSFALVGFLAAGSLIGESLWLWAVAGVVALAVVCLTAVARRVRKRLPRERRERLAYGSAVLALLAAPFAIAGMLLSETIQLLDAIALGGVVGLTVVVAVDRSE